MLKRKIENIGKFLVAWLIFSLGVYAVGYVSVWADAFFNPWISGLQLQWTSMFTTQHYWTWVYLKSSGFFYEVEAIGSAVLGFFLAIWLAAD